QPAAAAVDAKTRSPRRRASSGYGIGSGPSPSAGSSAVPGVVALSGPSLVPGSSVPSESSALSGPSVPGVPVLGGPLLSGTPMSASSSAAVAGRRATHSGTNAPAIPPATAHETVSRPWSIGTRREPTAGRVRSSPHCSIRIRKREAEEETGASGSAARNGLVPDGGGPRHDRDRPRPQAKPLPEVGQQGGARSEEHT